MFIDVYYFCSIFILHTEDDSFFASERDAVPDESASTFIFNAHHSLNLQAQRDQLPIRRYQEQILYCLENHQTLILVGETGSGKSTQVPQVFSIARSRYKVGYSTVHRVGWKAGENMATYVNQS